MQVSSLVNDGVKLATGHGAARGGYESIGEEASAHRGCSRSDEGGRKREAGRGKREKKQKKSKRSSKRDRLGR